MPPRDSSVRRKVQCLPTETPAARQLDLELDAIRPVEAIASMLDWSMARYAPGGTLAAWGREPFHAKRPALNIDRLVSYLNGAAAQADLKNEAAEQRERTDRALPPQLSAPIRTNPDETQADQ